MDTQTCTKHPLNNIPRLLEQVMSTSNKATKISNRRRFDDDQIKSLETIFQTESRPELRLKQHLANKLGLQPRQIAIWFQNKRARSKSKHIEEEYSVLKTNYDELAAQFENLRKENQSLLIQLQKLKNKADKRNAEEFENKNDLPLASSENSKILLQINSHGLCMPSCGDTNGKVDYLEEMDVLNMAHIGEGPLTSPENGCSFESCAFLDNSGSTSQWWDF